MKDLDSTGKGAIQALGEKWKELRPLEKVGVVAIGAGGVAVVAALALPSFATATLGGAFTGAGAYLLRRGFRG